jgi:Bacteriophage replication protein O
MPWANLTHERIQTMYKDIIEDRAVKNRDMDLLIKEMLVRAEILKRDFTKRQLVVLSVIVTFSYFYGKDSALIPKLQDFSLAGISPTKIKDELTKLEDLGVIDWKRGKGTNEFSIKDPRSWTVPYHTNYDDRRSKELFILNLKHAGAPVDIDSLAQRAITEDDR